MLMKLLHNIDRHHNQTKEEKHIMDNSLTIQKIRTVFEGEFNPGTLKRRNQPRHCDGFVYFTEGSADYLFDGFSFTASPENFIYLAHDGRYDIEIHQKSRFICIDFDFDDEGKVQRSCAFSNVPSNIKNEFLKMFYTRTKKSPWHFAQSLSVLYGLYAVAVRSDSREYAKKNARFSEITAYVLEHYTDPKFTVGELSEYVGVSEVHLRRLFRSAVNDTPIGYINFLKLEKAKNMLTTSNYSISEIAEASGFDDPYYFSRLFRQKIGMTPSSYRKSAAKTKPDR